MTMQVSEAQSGYVNGRTSGVAAAEFAKIGQGAIGVADALPPVGHPTAADRRPVLAPPEPVSTVHLSAAAEGLGRADDPVDIFTAMLMIIQKNVQEGRLADRQDREFARNTQASEQQQAADKIREGGVLGLISTVVSGALAIGGAGVSMAGAVKSEKLYSDAMKSPESLDLADAKLRLGSRSDDIKALKSNLETLQTQYGPMDAAAYDAAEADHAKAYKAVADAPDEETRAERQPALNEARSRRQATYEHKMTWEAIEEAKQDVDRLKLEVKMATDIAHPTLTEADVAGRSKSATWKAVGDMTTEGGRVIGAGVGLGKDEKDADKAEHDAAATRQQLRSDDDTDSIRNYADLLKSVIDQLSSAINAASETNKAILRV